MVSTSPALENDLRRVLTSEPDASTFVFLASAAGLLPFPKNRDTTLFVPTNAAFDAVPMATLNALLSNRAALREFLLYHTVAGRFNARALGQVNRLRTQQGLPVSVSGNARTSIVLGETATVTVANLRATNGVVHLLDGVLVRFSQRPT